MDNDIKIYFDHRIVILSGKGTQIDYDRMYIFDNKKALAKRLDRFGESDEEYLYIIHHDPDELFENVAKCFKYIEAAGGLVTLPDGRILMIRRLGKWDLPKGKAKKGESLHETAIREVMEECGLETAPIITADLAHTFHTYHRNGANVLKHTAWFSMRYDGENDRLCPQFEEDITEAVWMPKNGIETVLQNTYESIKQVFEKWLMING